jgi:hypothetical protein
MLNGLLLLTLNLEWDFTKFFAVNAVGWRYIGGTLRNRWARRSNPFPLRRPAGFAFNLDSAVAAVTAVKMSAGPMRFAISADARRVNP